MSYGTTTHWDDDDIVAESPDGLSRVVLRPDEDAELDGDYLPILVSHDQTGRTTSCTGERWYYPHDAVKGDDDAFARAVDHFIYGYGWDKHGRLVSGFDKLERWVRLFLGGTGVVQMSSSEASYFACDSAALRELWGTPDDCVYGEGVFSDEKIIQGFLDGEVYGYVVQTRESPDSEDWEDGDSGYGLIGLDYAESEARSALADLEGTES